MRQTSLVHGNPTLINTQNELHCAASVQWLHYSAQSLRHNCSCLCLSMSDLSASENLNLLSFGNFLRELALTLCCLLNRKWIPSVALHSPSVAFASLALHNCLWLLLSPLLCTLQSRNSSSWKLSLPLLVRNLSIDLLLEHCLLKNFDFRIFSSSWCVFQMTLQVLFIIFSLKLQPLWLNL